jgi:Bifunctional DNA primase/polymerase, N-terminal
VLDVDVKDPTRNGFDSLAELGLVPLPDTPLVHTQSGGLHIYFAAGEHDIRNSAGRLGPGLDVRGAGGYVILPSPRSGYTWDPHANLRSRPLAPPPACLIEVEPQALIPPLPPSPGRPAMAFVTPYGEAALYRAGRAIIGAACGEQETTLNSQCFAIGQLAGAGVVPPREARATLHLAAAYMRSYDPRRPWRVHNLKEKVDRAFDAGLRHPRAERHG